MSSNVSPPPCYDDLGRTVKDFFSKGYNFDTVSIGVKTKSATGFELNFGGTSRIDSGKILGTYQSFYRDQKYGIDCTKKWNTSNEHVNGVSFIHLLKGAKFSIEHTNVPHTGYRTVKAKVEYRNNRLALNTDVDITRIRIKSAGPRISGSGVFQCYGCFIGFMSKFDTKDSKLKSTKFALQYNAEDYVAYAVIGPGQLNSFHICQKVNPFLETGVEFAWSCNKNDTKFGFGCKYTWDRDTTIQAKVNKSGQIGLGFVHKLRDVLPMFIYRYYHHIIDFDQ
ncbi:voltage-dependent anion-selective channel-like isoform X2 [Planococcus citri]|uniref:voltage-dependent anion-selective channel-like isoform X2 n=1 Tax=Planococcus citri TaxID=170843 RepID=UPI0031F80C91